MQIDRRANRGKVKKAKMTTQNSLCEFKCAEVHILMQKVDKEITNLGRRPSPSSTWLGKMKCSRKKAALTKPSEMTPL
jgi:hypothetical protein